jgi:hypothetical protein
MTLDLTIKLNMYVEGKLELSLAKVCCCDIVPFSTTTYPCRDILSRDCHVDKNFIDTVKADIASGKLAKFDWQIVE